jgi:hypothetical protein
MPERGVDAAPEAMRRQRVTRALANPVYFAEQYVRPYDPSWIAPMPEFAREMLRFALGGKRRVVMLPPEFMKTTLLSQALPLWLSIDAAVHGKQMRGLLLSEEERMAIGNLNVVSWHILNNERIAADFTDAQGRPILKPDEEENVWREDAIIIQRPGASKDPTWAARGLDSKGIHGRRLDWVIGDDVITPINASSPALRKKALDTMDLVVSTRVVKNGHILMCGNFNDPKDLLHTLSGRKGWDRFKRPSMYVGEPHVAPKESELRTADLLWPDNWTRERLLEEYERTPNRFRRIHLMDPRAEHGERLNVSWCQLLDPDATPLRYCKFFIGIDPAPRGDTGRPRRRRAPDHAGRPRARPLPAHGPGRRRHRRVQGRARPLLHRGAHHHARRPAPEDRRTLHARVQGGATGSTRSLRAVRLAADLAAGMGSSDQWTPRRASGANAHGVVARLPLRTTRRQARRPRRCDPRRARVRLAR